MKTEIKEALRAIVGDEGFSDALIDLFAYSKDASEHQHRPDAALWPLTAEQISNVLKLANDDGFPVIPRGAGTSLAGLPIRHLRITT
ncbi:MAG: FAD-binding oxidoreductase [Deltaproteobacteria bacterium]|nr:FAD-binding oxidoreductase [Deltaproteobacteria bacterium]